MIALMVVTDGRRYCMEQMFESLRDNIGLDQFAATVVIDDGVDFGYTEFLKSLHPWTIHAYPTGTQKRGFGGAIQAGWKAVKMLKEEGFDLEYIFHMEDDFVMNRTVDLQELRGVLQIDPALAQIALKRQPWSPEEIEAGDLVSMWPNAYNQHWSKALDAAWYTHDLFFTTNPSLYSMRTVDIGWPNGARSEQAFSERCRDRAYHFGYIGRKGDKPWVTHVGNDRTGVGY